MNTLIISDLHLGWRFNKNKFNLIKEALLRADKVILNGDLWESFEINFDEFVTSEWSELFPIFKAKHTTYIYGNHDRPYSADERVNLFSDTQADAIDLTFGDHKFFLTHGDSLSSIDIGKKVKNLKYQLKEFGKLINKSFRVFHATEEYFLQYKTIYEKYLAFMNLTNQKTKEWIRENLPKDIIMIGSHTHVQEINFAERYVNPGFCKNGVVQYLLIDDDKIKPFSLSYSQQIPLKTFSFSSLR